MILWFYDVSGKRRRKITVADWPCVPNADSRVNLSGEIYDVEYPEYISKNGVLQHVNVIMTKVKEQ